MSWNAFSYTQHASLSPRTLISTTANSVARKGIKRRKHNRNTTKQSQSNSVKQLLLCFNEIIDIITNFM